MIQRKIKFFLFIVACLIMVYPVVGQKSRPRIYNDGPYVFLNKDKIKVSWVNQGLLYDTTFHENQLAETDLSFINASGINYQDYITKDIEPDHQTIYENIERITAISDIHGQYDLMWELLLKNDVIDEDGAWIYGDGHLVVTGDIFDRGDKVMDIVWFFIRLEQEAASAGGKVHIMIGNHEWMVLDNDLRYIHKNYRYTSALFRKPYGKLFDKKTFIGKWLRSKPVYLKINDISFVHGGISEDFFRYRVPLDELNGVYLDKLFYAGRTPSKDPFIHFIAYENGPLWYRGYAEEDEYDLRRTDKLLKKLESEHIVVGHTSMSRVSSIFNNKIIFIDSGIKLGKGGEILIINQDRFYRANERGISVRL